MCVIENQERSQRIWNSFDVCVSLIAPARKCLRFFFFSHAYTQALGVFESVCYSANNI